MSRKLDIYIDTTVCGQLSEINNIWSFQYLQDWLNSPSAHPLSPNIIYLRAVDPQVFNKRLNIESLSSPLP